jgi:hypothetical protein
MAREMPPVGSGLLQTVRLRDRDYWLVPMNEAATQRRNRAQRSELQPFHSSELNDMEEFKYEKLASGKNSIRLLQLRSGTTHGPDIYCDLIEADYNNSFHIPTKIPVWRDETKQDEKPETEAKLNLTEEEKRQIAYQERREELDKVEANQIEYEALSWCWGTDPPEYAVQIQHKGITYKKRVKKELALALKYLRLPNQTRTLWIDAICIDQDNYEERNQQVQMMARIYTRAKEVCIWLGEDSDESKTAIDFIHDEIMELKNFDTICSDKSYTDKWRALMMLMQRDWFSRRWVVQEIALASKATLYCGPDSLPWKEFAVAVELFVEVETATHRLSEVMQKDEKFRHVPGWFEYVSELGASLLVQATGKIFRAHGTPMQDSPRDDERRKEQILRETTIDPLDRRSLLSLEYLVSTMFIFNATEPRDAIYALLAIARDAAPFAMTTYREGDPTILMMTLMDRFLEEKPFVVDYSRPYEDVCRDFVEFSIRRKTKLDPAQALDILCRPWALDHPTGKSTQVQQGPVASLNKSENKSQMTDKPRQWKIRKYGLQKQPDGRWRHVEAEDDEWEVDSRGLKEYWAKVEAPEELPLEHGETWKKPGGWDVIKMLFEDPTSKPDNHASMTKKDRLPSWVAPVSQAPFSLYHHPGMHILKTGRANADPLVGHPQDGHRNYSAAQTQEVDLASLKFRKRPKLGHYSLYIRGFELDEVVDVRDASQGGYIPKSWLDLGGWEHPYQDDPPDEFWRTLVADRGRENRNPPYYYARACKESVHKGGIASGRVNTTDLINNERNSIVAEFCRRVHAVIWGRRLYKTKSGRLGLASKVQEGDLVCIIYGCTVPVILTRKTKGDGDPEMAKEKAKQVYEREQIEDRFEMLKSCIRRLEKNRKRRARYNHIKWMKEEMEDLRTRSREIEKKLEERSAQKMPAKINEEARQEHHLFYELKGETYVHGMMDGEALRKKFYKNLPDILFEVR